MMSWGEVLGTHVLFLPRGWGVPLSLSWNKGGGRGGAGNDVLGGGVGYPCPFPAQGVGSTPVLVLF